jgi:uncharacterized protein YyaL (SSP411 family)
MISSLSTAIIRYPTSFGAWACLLLEKICGTYEIAVIGSEYTTLYDQLLAEYMPYKIIMGSISGDNNYPLLSGKGSNEQTMIYLCHNYACQKPVSTIVELLSFLKA